MHVIFGEPAPETVRIRGAETIAVADLGDARKADRLDKDVWRQERQPRDRPPGKGGVDEGDGGAIRMAEQQRIVKAGPIHELRQNCQRLLVHEGWRAGAAEGVGVPVAEARIDERPGAEARRHPIGEIAPQRGTAQPLVQENQRRSRAVAGDDAIFKPPPGDGGKLHAKAPVLVVRPGNLAEPSAVATATRWPRAPPRRRWPSCLRRAQKGGSRAAREDAGSETEGVRRSTSSARAMMGAL